MPENPYKSPEAEGKRLRPHRSFESLFAFVMFVLLPTLAAVVYGVVAAMSARS